MAAKLRRFPACFCSEAERILAGTPAEGELMTCRFPVAGVLLCGLLLAVSPGCATGAADDGTAPDPTAVGNDDALRQAASSSGYTQTRYPIVLAHGMAGFQQLLGVLDYFYRIPDELRAGGAKVYVTQVSAFASSVLRGEQLLAQVEYIAAASGAGKVNLIGHSQGGLDVRYVLATRPDLVASVTTVGSPHQGAGLADWLLDHIDGDGFSGIVLSTFANSLGLILDLLAGTDNPQDSFAALEQLGSDGTAAFNALYPAGLPAAWCGGGAARWNGVALYSWSGTSKLTNLLDVTDTAMGIAGLFTSESNDGLVGRCSSHFGTVLRDTYRMNHLDEVNQLLGLVSIFESSPTTVFRAHANRLKNAGL
jgi:triacylglycerol lipase